MVERVLFSPGGATAAKQDVVIAGVGAPADAEATGNGTLIAVLKRLRTLLNGGLPAALGGAGGVKVEQQGNVVVGNFPASQTVTGPLTDTQLRATAVPVSGTVTVGNFPATQPVSAASLPLPSGAGTEATLALIKAKTDNLDVALSTRAVTGLTDAQLRAAAVPVSGAFFQGTQPISAAALPLPSGATTEATLAAMLAEFRAKYDVVQTAKATYTTSGDHNLITPSAGQSLRVVWLFAQAKGALDTGVVLVTFTLGANSYEFELTGSQPFAHGAVWEGAVDQVLVVNTSSTAAVLVNADYRVF